MYIHLYLYTSKYLYIYIYMYIHFFICIYLYSHINIVVNTYNHICRYTCIYVYRSGIYPHVMIGMLQQQNQGFSQLDSAH